MHCYSNVLINQPKISTCDMPLSTVMYLDYITIWGKKKNYDDQYQMN